MKTATLSALRVDPKLREAEDDFIARGLHSAQEARKTNEYVSAAHVVANLKMKLAAASLSARRA